MRRRLGAPAKIDLELEGDEPCSVSGCAAFAAEGLPVCGSHWGAVPQGEQVVYLEAMGSVLSAPDPVEKRRKARARVVTILRGVST